MNSPEDVLRRIGRERRVGEVAAGRVGGLAPPDRGVLAPPDGLEPPTQALGRPRPPAAGLRTASLCPLSYGGARGHRTAPLPAGRRSGDLPVPIHVPASTT